MSVGYTHSLVEEIEQLVRQSQSETPDIKVDVHGKRSLGANLVVAAFIASAAAAVLQAIALYELRREADSGPQYVHNRARRDTFDDDAGVVVELSDLARTKSLQSDGGRSVSPTLPTTDEKPQFS